MPWSKDDPPPEHKRKKLLKVKNTRDSHKRDSHHRDSHKRARVTSIVLTKRKKKPMQRAKDILEKTRVCELDWQLRNAKTILRCSNATPIKSYTNSKFACSFCDYASADPKKLKEHTLTDHPDCDAEKPDFQQIKLMSKFIVYMDTTALKCLLCGEKIHLLKDFLMHLKKDHDESVHTEINNHILAFKFDSYGELKCVECSKECVDFDALTEHTATHYQNYRCEFCELSFLNRSLMIDHKQAVHNILQKVRTLAKDL